MCFTLRLHTSAAPPQGGLTQALGGNKHLFQLHRLARSAASLIAAPLPFLTAAPNVFGYQALLRKICGPRSKFTCVTFAGFGNGDWCGQFFRNSYGRFGDTRWKVHGCAPGPSRFGFRQVRQGSICTGVHLPPNNSFKPTPCRGVGRVLCATLAHVRCPATGRLNSSVRCQTNHVQRGKKNTGSTQQEWRHGASRDRGSFTQKVQRSP